MFSCLALPGPRPGRTRDKPRPCLSTLHHAPYLFHYGACPNSIAVPESQSSTVGLGKCSWPHVLPYRHHPHIDRPVAISSISRDGPTLPSAATKSCRDAFQKSHESTVVAAANESPSTTERKFHVQGCSLQKTAHACLRLADRISAVSHVVLCEQLKLNKTRSNPWAHNPLADRTHKYLKLIWVPWLFAHGSMSLNSWRC